MKYKGLASIAFCFAAACGKPAEAPQAAQPKQEITAPAGEYRLDKSHASLVFQIDHLGFSMYTASFSDFGATLEFNPEDPESMSVSASIKVPSLTIPAPPEGFHEELMGPDWFNARAHPGMSFRSTNVTLTGDRIATVEGELKMLGATAPVTMEAEFIGGYAGYPPYDPNARIGFSAHGTLRRSDFGFTHGLPPEGTTMGVGDLVSFEINAEFTGPPAPAPAEE
ncbi:YceI family protein [Hyphococcus sp.]|jgi:polyisoprenoid-binding protein YceI|uniref:YceI family protein n=1 Tax=Hyphococcus sp. TaxID=2038636 RepID=UPI003D123383